MLHSSRIPRPKNFSKINFSFNEEDERKSLEEQLVQTNELVSRLRNDMKNQTLTYTNQMENLERKFEDREETYMKKMEEKNEEIQQIKQQLKESLGLSKKFESICLVNSGQAEIIGRQSHKLAEFQLNSRKMKQRIAEMTKTIKSLELCIKNNVSDAVVEHETIIEFKEKRINQLEQEKKILSESLMAEKERVQSVVNTKIKLENNFRTTMETNQNNQKLFEEFKSYAEVLESENNNLKKEIAWSRPHHMDFEIRSPRRGRTMMNDEEFKWG